MVDGVDEVRPIEEALDGTEPPQVGERWSPTSEDLVELRMSKIFTRVPSPGSPPVRYDLELVMGREPIGDLFEPLRDTPSPVGAEGTEDSDPHLGTSSGGPDHPYRVVDAAADIYGPRGPGADPGLEVRRGNSVTAESLHVPPPLVRSRRARTLDLRACDVPLRSLR